MRRTRTVVIAGLAVAACSSAPAIESAEDLVRAMHDRYAGQWYESLSFLQDAIFFDSTGAEVNRQIWYEAMRVPNRLRIDIGPAANGQAVIYNGDSLYRFAGGQLATATAQTNVLLVLGFDVYGQVPERTLEVLANLGYDLTKFHEAEWEGRPMYVVGADEGDMTSRQFWIEQERLLFARLFQPAGPNGANTQEIQFNEYEPLGGGWIAPDVRFFTNGRMTFHEVYDDMVAEPELGPDLFNPHAFGPPAWVETQGVRREGN